MVRSRMGDYRRYRTVSGAPTQYAIMPGDCRLEVAVRLTAGACGHAHPEDARRWLDRSLPQNTIAIWALTLPRGSANMTSRLTQACV